MTVWFNGFRLGSSWFAEIVASGTAAVNCAGEVDTFEAAISSGNSSSTSCPRANTSVAAGPCRQGLHSTGSRAHRQVVQWSLNRMCLHTAYFRRCKFISIVWAGFDFDGSGWLRCSQSGLRLDGCNADTLFATDP